MSIQARSAPASSSDFEPEWRLRLAVRRERRALDRELAEGVDPDRGPALALGARQLAGTAERRRIAACMANIVDAAEEYQSGPGSRLVLDHAAVITARDEIVALIGYLRSDATVDPREVALARLLIEERTSPLFHAWPDRTLRQALAEIVDSL